MTIIRGSDFFILIYCYRFSLFRYKLAVQLWNQEKEITCVLFDDAANLLLGLTAEQLIMKTLSKVVESSNEKNFFVRRKKNKFQPIRMLYFTSFNISI